MAMKIFKCSRSRFWSWSTFPKNCLVLVYLYVIVCSVVNAFNVDLENTVRHRGTSQSMFGFSVAQYKANGSSWVLVGAPESPDNYNTPDYRGGAVFYCDINTSDSCHRIPFFNTRSTDFRQVEIDNKANQWFGATVRSSGEDGIILACAPKYYWYGIGGNSSATRDPVGTCYTSNSQFNQFTEYSPCRSRTRNSAGYSRLGSCQAGFGAAISKNSSRIYIGAVGSFYWQGQIISQSIFNRTEFTATKEGQKAEDDSYMGYSVSNIEFYGTRLSGVAVGVPRGENLLGKVKLLTWNVTTVKTLVGEQFASYFGYSISVVDIDGDGSEDVVVGAPMYSDFSPNKNEYETGRVYVFYQGSTICKRLESDCWDNKFNNYQFIDGLRSKSRFGLAVTSLGDINQDGYGDFAVGAPYEGSFGGCRRSPITGAVYIFHGSKTGVRSTHSQVITAADMAAIYQTDSLTTFGFALAGGMDLDNNHYPDLVVGAYESDKVYVYRSRPVIQLVANFSFLSNKKVIALDEYRCSLKNNMAVPCVQLQMCLEYDGVAVEDQIDLQVQITLDSKKHAKSARMFFLDNEGTSEATYQFTLQKRGNLCKKMETYIPHLDQSQDKLTPLEARMKYKLIDSGYRKKTVLSSVLNMDDETPLTRIDTMKIKNNCGEENICIPDLQMTVSSNVKQYILGSGRLMFNVSVENRGQDSFGSVFKMKIPPGIHYSTYEVTYKPYRDLLLQCYAPNFYNNYTVTCTIGNPLPSGKSVNFTIILDPSNEVEEQQFDFWVNVNASNPIISQNMNVDEQRFTILIMEETSLRIDEGNAKNSKEIYYNASNYNAETITTDTEAGPYVEHEYIIKNLGPSEILKADVVFYWPASLGPGEDLLYLLNEPVLKGNIRCSPVGSTNYKNLELRRRIEEAAAEQQREISAGHTSKGTSHGSSSTSVHTHGSTTITGSSSGSSKTTKTSSSTNVSQTSSSKTVKGSTNVNEIQGGWSGDRVYAGNKNVEVDKGSGGNGNGVFRVGVVDSSQGTSYIGANGERQSNVGGITSYSGSQDKGVYTGHSGGSSTIHTYGGGQYSGGSSKDQYSGSSSQGQYTGNSFQGQYSGSAQSSNDGRFVFISGGSKGSGSTGNERKNVNVHETEETVVKSTKWDDNGPRTYVEKTWKTNDNGVVRNGSFSSVNPTYGYHENNLNFDKGNSYTGHQGSTYYNQGSSSGSSHDIDVVTQNKGVNIDRGTFYTGQEGSTNYNQGSSLGSSHGIDVTQTKGVNVDRGTFFTGQQGSTYYNQGSSSGSSHGVDVTQTKGGSVSRVYDAKTGTYITNIDEGVHVISPEKRRRENETDSVYHYRSEHTQVLRPTHVSEDRIVYNPDVPINEIQAKYDAKVRQIIGQADKKLPIQHSSQNEEYDEDEAEDDEEDDEQDVEDEKPSRVHHRTKRQSSANGHDRKQFCTYADCIKVTCSVGRLARDEEVSVTFQSVVWIKTIQKIAVNRPVEIGSFVEVNILQLPHIRTPITNVTYYHEYKTNVTSLEVGKTSPDVIPLWIVVGSACLGALILMLLVYLLYRSGFFKRNRPPALPERQPLNRNGQYHMGDEAL